eukprot:1606617-Rhodomonas_salina.2
MLRQYRTPVASYATSVPDTRSTIRYGSTTQRVPAPVSLCPPSLSLPPLGPPPPPRSSSGLGSEFLVAVHALSVPDIA